MFTTHTNKQEFYNWWKQQDHKGHNCNDMVLFTLCKAYWSEPEGPRYLYHLKRAFRWHHWNGYQAVEDALYWLTAYGGKYHKCQTFRNVIDVQNDREIIQLIARFIKDEVREVGVDQNATAS